MKPIVAVSGDLVKFSSEGVAVNGALLPNSAPQHFDSKRRRLQHWAFGTYRVHSGTLWVISSYDPRSFDSRYFGPIFLSSIRTHLLPLMTE